MSAQAKRLESWIIMWDVIFDLLGIVEPTPESQELLDALAAMGED